MYQVYWLQSSERAEALRDGWWNGIHQAEGEMVLQETDVNLNCAGGWAGLEWDPLPREANHPDGEAQEELQWESEWRMSIEIIGI